MSCSLRAVHTKLTCNRFAAGHKSGQMEKRFDPIPWLTLSGAAKLLNVPTHTVLNMIRCKALPARKVGGEWRISRSEVTKWVQRHPEA
jgi:excisionase family DNA binding protein